MQPGIVPTTTPKRIVFTSAFGHPRFARMALGLGRSLRLIGDTTHRVVMTDMRDMPWEPAFDQVLYCNVPKDDLYWSKFYALNLTDADEILYVDSDSLAFKRLDPVFDYFEGSPFGVQGTVLSSGLWWGKERAQVCQEENVSGLCRINAGLLYYTRTPEFDRILAEAKTLGARYQQGGWQLSLGVPSEEVCLSVAMAKLDLGRIAPDEMDFHNPAMGLIGKLNMDVRKGECRFLSRELKVRLVEPNLFHAWRYKFYLIYWRQLKRLEALERYEKNRVMGHMTYWQRTQRSIEKRILAIRGDL